MKYSIITFGCRVNQADSLQIEDALRARGAIDAPAIDADLVVVNTCSVTASADQGARQTIRRVARDNPAARLVVTGCYATRAPAEISRLPNVVSIIGNRDKHRLVETLDEGLAMTTVERFGGGDGPCGLAVEPGMAGRTAFTLRVQTGCEERCSYCIIPTTRGAARSMPISQAVREIERISSAGFKEIALTGVHLGSYGRDLQPPGSLAGLLREVAAAAGPGVVFRISSLEPMDCTEEIVGLVAQSGGRFAPHFHLPLQHASDGVLARMRRPYTLALYRRLVDRILERLPHASIGSDLIVGFPGESDDEFGANLDYLPSSSLSHLHVFPYSDRPGTVASRLRGRVAGARVRERSARLRAIGAALASRFRESQVGTVRAGLTLEDGTLVVTDNYLKVRIPAGVPRNERIRVRIERAAGALVGQVVHDPD
ncbi:MAG TPA: MiaB/RimO family radical SAM methylthiotransferase [Vicinamibacterales bacterium]|nr:MiaB/RimO family radical SAM methylthiotransferase [Vicinamibacterales bacterium]